MSQAGALNIRFGRDSAANALLSIESTRPQGLTRLLQNRTIVEAHQVVSLLFSVCRRAQTVAASRVAEQLMGVTVPVELEQHRDQMLRLELLHEHLWTLLVQLPPRLGLPPRTDCMAEASQILRCAMSGMDRRSVLSGIFGIKAVADDLPAVMDLAAWAGQLYESLFTGGNCLANELVAATRLQDWRSDYHLCGVQSFSGEDLVSRLIGDPAFSHQPQWQQQPRETGAVVRQADRAPVFQALQQGWCLQPRLLAIVLEVQWLLKWLLAGASRAATGKEDGGVNISNGNIESASPRFALTQLETARGGLIHGVELNPERERIARYWIIAPTDWNFHPQGVLHTMVEKLPETEAEQAHQRLALLVMMMNPCVGWEVQSHA